MENEAEKYGKLFKAEIDKSPLLNAIRRDCIWKQTLKAQEAEFHATFIKGKEEPRYFDQWKSVVSHRDVFEKFALRELVRQAEKILASAYVIALECPLATQVNGEPKFQYWQSSPNPDSFALPFTCRVHENGYIQFSFLYYNFFRD